MTVRELLEELHGLDGIGFGGIEVGFAYPSGDHWRTVLVGEVRKTTHALVKHSSYHERLALIDEDDGDDEPALDPEARSMVVLR